jgi:hypothetical protein
MTAVIMRQFTAPTVPCHPVLRRAAEFGRHPRMRRARKLEMQSHSVDCDLEDWIVSATVFGNRAGSTPRSRPRKARRTSLTHPPRPPGTLSPAIAPALTGECPCLPRGQFFLSDLPADEGC